MFVLQSFVSVVGPTWSFLLVPLNGGLSPAGFPPSALSSLLAQSAMSSGFPSAGFSQGGYEPIGFSSAGFSPAGFEPSGFPSAGYPLSGFSSAGFGPNRFPSSGFPSYGSPNTLSGNGVSPSAFSQMSPFQSLSPMGPSGPAGFRSPQSRFNAGQYSAESLTPVLVDFPPLPSSNDPRQAGRNFPSSRSIMDRSWADHYSFVLLCFALFQHKEQEPVIGCFRNIVGLTSGGEWESQQMP